MRDAVARRRMQLWVVQLKAVDAGILPGGHQSRQILRIGEEGEDAVNREGNPLLGHEREPRFSLLLLARSSAGCCWSVSHSRSVDAGLYDRATMHLRNFPPRFSVSVCGSGLVSSRQKSQPRPGW